MEKDNLQCMTFMAPRAYWPRDFLAMRRAAVFQQSQEQSKQEIERPYNVVNGIADIPIKGIIYKGGFEFWGETDPVKKSIAVKMAAMDESVDQILLRIDSPGGSVDGVAVLAESVYQARQSKPVIAQVEGMAASAALWVASQSSKVYANSLDMVGSIGVYSVVPDDVEYWKSMGVTWHLFTTGDYKGAAETGQEITEPQKAEFQRIVNVYFDAFKTAIKRGRGMDKKALDAISDGRLFIGPEAVAVGLVDKIQTTEQTVENMLKPKRGAASRARALRLVDLAAQSRG
jgi:signal peptide peptidase SppA